MFKWCAYCQNFMGECAPFHDFALTHGMCSGCDARGGKGFVQFNEKTVDLFNRIFVAAQHGDLNQCHLLATEAMAAKYTPSSIAIGLIQPALYKIGRMWQQGEISVAIEHRFTNWCERMLQPLFNSTPSPHKKTHTLIVLVDGNYHTLGPRILGLMLAEAGYGCEIVTPGLPADEIQTLVTTSHPELLCISVATTMMFATVQELVTTLKRASLDVPEIVVGGAALRQTENLPDFGTKPLITANDLLDQLQKNLLAETNASV